MVYDEIRVALAHNHQLLRNTSFEAAADLLAAAKMTYVYGQGGGSTALADELRFRLVRFGRPVASRTACCSGWWPRRCRATPSSSRCR